MILEKALEDVVGPDGDPSEDYDKEYPTEYSVSASYYPKGWKQFNDKDMKMWIKINAKLALNKLINEQSEWTGDVELSTRDLDILEDAYNVGAINFLTVKNIVYGVDDDEGNKTFKFPDKPKKFSKSERDFVMKNADKENLTGFESRIFEAQGSAGLAEQMKESKKLVQRPKFIIHASNKSSYSERKFFESGVPEPGDKTVDLDWQTLTKIPSIRKQIEEAITPTVTGILRLYIRGDTANAKYIKTLETAKDPLNELDTKANVFYLEEIDFQPTKRYSFRDVTELRPEMQTRYDKQKKYKLREYIRPEGKRGRAEEGGQKQFTDTNKIAMVSYMRRQMNRLKKWVMDK